MLRCALILPLLLVCLLSVNAQVGTIKGHIRDITSGESIIGANILLRGTSTGASADINGDFEIPKVKAGVYDLVVSFVSYKTDTLKGITVYTDQTTVITHALREVGQELSEIVISGTRSADTDISIITDMRKNDLVAAGISAQQISMSQDRDAAQVIRRVPGVTIVNSRFVNVRGLSERYNMVMLNGIIASSSEVDSKAFSFDLIPSNMIDRMMVNKSGAANLPGEFAGAGINITTKGIVEENTMSLSVSGSFRANTTGQTVSLSRERSASDWLGGGTRLRELPATFPSQNLRAFSNNPNDQNVAALVNATRLLPNTWGTRQFDTSPDARASLDISRTFNIGAAKFDNITSLSYARTSQLLELTQNYYDAFSPAEQKSTARYRYNDERFTQTSRAGAVSNFTIELNPSNRIELRNFYNQQSQNQSTFRRGTDNAQGFDVNNQAFNYLQRSLYSGQLSGKHGISDALNLNWIFGYNNTSASQPDYRRIRSQRPTGTEDSFSIVIPPGASSFDAGRFYSKLREQTYSAAGNVDLKLTPGANDDDQAKVMAGYYVERKDRTFNARWVSYKWLNPRVIDNSLLRQPFDQIFDPRNLGTKFILEEGTNEGPDLYDKYDGHNRLLAGYAGIVTPFAGKFRLSAGIRVEDNVQQIDVYDADGNKKQAVNSESRVPMPFSNLSYDITDNMLVRLAYSKTVNRPVFRELAPFNYYDFDRNADVNGNPNLKTARIDNVDVRWELYPSKTETISLGSFYKHFNDPIEQYLKPGSNLIYSYTNAKKAISYGAEVEVRKSFDDASSPLLRKLSLVLNAALIRSEIELPSKLDNLQSDRAMQGQSPCVVNASLYYHDAERGLQVSAQYNVFGKRIFAVGDKDANANQYEMPRHQVDLTVSKQLSHHFEFKAGIQDILNQPYRLIQDSNRDRKITDIDESIQTYRLGQYATVGAIWKF